MGVGEAANDLADQGFVHLFRSDSVVMNAERPLCQRDPRGRLMQISAERIAERSRRDGAMQLDGPADPRQSRHHTLSYGRTTMKLAFRFFISTSLLFAASAAIAATDTPVGTWKTIDDETHQAKSIVEITDNNGELQAHIVKLLNRSAEDIARDGEVALCKNCEGERKDKPIEGMNIMWGVHKNGHILYPNTGKVYNVKLSMLDGCQKRNVRGYIGFSWFGRSQQWERQP